MNVAELRQALAELPDWYDVQVCVLEETGHERFHWVDLAELVVPDGGTMPRVVIR